MFRSFGPDAYVFTPPNENVNGAANGLNQLTNVGAAALTYDARGNVTFDGAMTYGYDSENRLVSASGGVSLSYDPLGRLAQVSGPAGTTRFLWDGLDLIAELDGSNVLQKRYVHGDGIDEPIVWYEGSGTSDRRFLSSDERGSIVSVTDGSGNLLGINRYDEYGVPQGTNIGRFQYTGQIWLSESGLYYYKNRMLDPAKGRFMQADPIGYEDSPNLYAYVLNDPVNLVDPLGLATDCGPTHPHDCNPLVPVSEPEIIITGQRLPRRPTPAVSIDPFHTSRGGAFAGKGAGGGGGGGGDAPTAQEQSGACEFGPLTSADQNLFNQARSDPFVSSSIDLIGDLTVRTGREWSAFVYPSDNGLTVGALWQGPAGGDVPRANRYAYRSGFLLARIKPVINIHGHPGIHSFARYPSWADSNYGLMTNTLSIVVSRGGHIEAGRQCARTVR